MEAKFSGITRETRARSDDKPFNICLNPPEYDVQLADQGVTNRVGDPESRCEGCLRVCARWPVHGLQIVAHVAIENLRRRALNEKRSGTHRRRALIALAESGTALLGSDVVGHGGARDPRNRLV